MKFKVRGLVFVGFAAAILSANAMAASDNTVTSKSYVDTHFQVKSSAASIGNTEGNWTPLAGTVTNDSTTAPTSAAVKAYVDNQVQTAGGNYQTKSAAEDENKVANGNGGWKALNTDIATTTDTGNGATTAAIKTYVANQLAAQNQLDDGEYQPQTTDNYQIGGANGTWADLGTGFANGTYTTKSVDSNGVVTIDANGTTDTTLAATGETGKLPTAATVKTYVDNAIATQAAADAGDYQEKSDASYQVGGASGTWETMAAGTYTTLSRDTTDPDNPLVKYDVNAATAASGITSGASTIPTSGAVADYVQSQTNGQVLPMPSSCTATNPCALITDGTSGSPMWVPIAQAEANVGA